MNNADWLGAEDRRVLWHPFTQMRDWAASEPVVLVEGRGAWLRDSRGREYLDGNSSIWTNLHGHGHPAIVAAVEEQLRRVAHVSFLGTSNEPAIRLAVKLVAACRGSALQRVFFSDNGSTAVEVAVKMALQYWQLVGEPQRERFVAFGGAYHGDTSGAASLGGLAVFFDRFRAVQFEARRVDAVEELERWDEGARREVAAVIIEPLVRGAAGIRLWPKGMLRALRRWCEEAGALLIFDEVLTGFGRTGRMFAWQHEGVAPDFLCLGKGLSGGVSPLAATLTTERIFEAFLGEFAELKTFFYGHSYCGHALGCAAALANLEIFEREGTLAALPGKIAAMQSLLEPLRRHPKVAEIRQCGLIAGVELQQRAGVPYDWREATGARVCLAARAHGLLTRPILDTVVLMPPLCVTKEDSPWP